MANNFASGKNANAECDECGLTFKLHELRKLTANEIVTNMKVCPDCWVPDQPQYKLSHIKISDPQALFEPRPDVRPNDLTNIAWGWLPVYAVASSVQLGTVTVNV
jgi:hypothetical protein